MGGVGVGDGGMGNFSDPVCHTKRIHLLLTGRRCAVLPSLTGEATPGVEPSRNFAHTTSKQAKPVFAKRLQTASELQSRI